MVYAIIKVDGSSAVTSFRQRIPAGIIGAQVQFAFGTGWTGRSRTVVFQAGDLTKDVLLKVGEDTAVIPPEVVAEPVSSLRVGVYGTKEDGTALPTLWAELGRVYYAADPSGDESTAPSLPVWAQLQQQMDELKQSGGPGGGTGKDGGYYTPTVTQPSENKLEFVFTPSNEDMPAVQPVQVTLPAGQSSGGNVDVSVDGETLVFTENSTATIENETLIL